MEYKEFRVTVLDDKSIRATLPSRVTRNGTVQKDELMERTIRIFHTWLAEGKIKNREELVVFGTHLYKVLFNGDIHTAFKATYDEIQQQQDTCLRLVLEFEQKARDLATLPWEYIYYPDTDREKGFQIATRSKLILARQVPLSDAAIDLIPSEKPLRILIVVSKAKSEELGIVKSDPVIEAIEELKNRLPDAIEIHMLFQPDRRTFSDKVKESKPHVLQFIGHGRWDKEQRSGQLAFVDKNNDDAPVWIDDLDFADYFQDFPPRLIFLHACEGASSESYEGFRGVALQLVYSKVPAVVAMHYPIKNKAAIEFSKKFYECLGEGKPIDVAVQEGRLELGMYLDPKHFSSRAFGSPVVYLQSAEGIIIAEATAEPRKSHEPTAQRIPCPNRNCSGYVISTDVICLSCKHRLMLCPKCAKVMSESIGICPKCGYGAEASEASTRKADRVKEDRDSKRIQGLKSMDRQKGMPSVHATTHEPGHLHKSVQSQRKSARSSDKKSQP
jgi:DNA-directed RNA polymerase subunit M/transcription elongation factor TFIIS